VIVGEIGEIWLKTTRSKVGETTDCSIKYKIFELLNEIIIEKFERRKKPKKSFKETIKSLEENEFFDILEVNM